MAGDQTPRDEGADPTETARLREEAEEIGRAHV